MKARNILFYLLVTLCFGFSALTIMSCDLPIINSDSKISDEINSIPFEETSTSNEEKPHVHGYIEIEFYDATCTEAGHATYMCNCGDVAYSTWQPKGHTEVVDEAVEPTCTETGLTAGKHCSECNEVLVEQEVVAALGHTEVVDEAVEATCTETGLTAGKHCSECEEVLVSQEEVAALGHNYEVIEHLDATCENIGYTTYVCSHDITHTYSDIHKATGHTEEIDAAVAPTCTETGLTEGKHCSECKEVLVVQQVVAELGHNYEVSNHVDATCENDGHTTFVCSHDTTHTYTDVHKATGHTEVVDAAVEPTCTETGLTAGKHCSACEEVLVAQEEVAALGHNYEVSDHEDATCEEDGHTTYVCSHDSAHTYTDTHKATGHTEEIDAAVAPTCTETGLTEGKHCSECKEVLVVQQVVAELGHNYEVSNHVDATCENDGHTTFVCSHDTTHTYTDVHKATGHTEVVDAAVEPTCTETGLTAGKHCSACEEVLVAQEEVAALGHNYEVSDHEDATCEEDGHTTYVCSHDITHTYSDIHKATGHTEEIDAAVAPTCTETGLTAGKHCSACEEVLVAQEEVAALGHNYEVSDHEDATCEEDGHTTYVCSHDSAHTYTDTHKATGHTEEIDAAVAPTCTETGLTEGKHCSECKEVLVVQQVVAELGHNYEVSNHVDATCENDGHTTFVCSHDTTHTYTDVHKATGHTEVVDAAVEPTCTETGLTEGKHCSACKEVLVVQQVVAALGHSYVDYICSECGYNYYTEGLQFTLSSDGTYYSVSIGTAYDVTEIVIPAIYNDKPVTSVDGFDNCEATSVVIGNNVTIIGDYAFTKCTSLKSITIPDSVIIIDEYAFSWCSSLESVTIGNNVTSIGTFAFIYCSSLTSIDIPNNVTIIGTGVFSRCSSLESVTIGKGVTSIGNHVFSECNALTSIYYKGTIENWCNITFISPLNNNDIKNFYMLDENNNYHQLTSVIIPNTVMTIGDYAFDNFSSLTSIIIPDSVTSIGYCAFDGCSSLENVTIGNGVTSIDDLAFRDCSSLTSIIIPDSVTSIGDSAFYDCDSLTSIIIPDSVTSISSFTFDSCKSLESVTIGNGVTSIGAAAFQHCSSLTSIVIPDSVTSISSSTFNSCKSLESVTIGNGVTSIGDAAFQHCSSVVNVYYTGTEEQWNDITIGSRNDYLTNATIYFYENYTEGLMFKLSEDGNSYIIIRYNGTSTNVIVPSTYNWKPITSIAERAFHYCESITSVIIPDSVTSIGYEAFWCCRSLESIEIPDSVTSIGNHSFGGCDALTSIEIPDSVTSIGKYAFTSCNSLENVIIGSGVTSFGEYAFVQCVSLKNVTIKNCVSSIGKGAFDDCVSLTSIEIPDSVTSIGDYAFYSCTSLTSITIPNSVTSIGNDAFKGCSSLTSITIPNSVTSIGESAFEGCTSLTSVTIGNGVTSIGEGAFKGCSSLTSIEIPDNVTSIDNHTFRNCVLLESVEIGNNVTGIGVGAFHGCSSLTSIEIPDSVTNIDLGAFQGCNSLTSIIISDSVTSIGNAVFLYGLSIVYYKGTEEQWKDITIGENNYGLSNSIIIYNYLAE